MKINVKTRTIHCFWCKKDIEMCHIYLHVLYEGSVTCEKNHLVGNDSDEEWLFLTGGRYAESN
jgi:hypothetical protein